VFPEDWFTGVHAVTILYAVIEEADIFGVVLAAGTVEETYAEEVCAVIDQAKEVKGALGVYDGFKADPGAEAGTMQVLEGHDTL
jgi:hypothetical protein